VRGFVLPERVEAAQGVLRDWASLIGGGGFSSFREQDLLPSFLSEVCGTVLGYTEPAPGSGRFTSVKGRGLLRR
jgi:hypothetical protein